MSSAKFTSNGAEEEKIEADSDEEEYDDSAESSDSDLDSKSSEYLHEIVLILNQHNVVKSNNALVLNKEMQSRLLTVRSKLHQLLDEIKKRLAVNEQRLQQNLKRSSYEGVGMRGAYLRGGTFYFKGNMFFKDRNCRNCPNNPDYIRRSAAGEMFPMDADLRGRHVWSLADKAGIVEAIKEQVIVHLGDQRFQPRMGLLAPHEKHKRDLAICSEKLANLLGRVDESFVIDWHQVHAHNLNYRHSANSCKAMWMMYLCPSLDRSQWTAEQNDALLEAAKMHAFENWDAIAAAVGKRSAYQCFVQFQTEVCYMLPDRWDRWSKCDDQRLLRLINHHTTHGVINWNAIAQHFPKKPKYSILQRYTDYLHPRLSHKNFTPEEDLLLLTAIQEYGPKFSCLPRTLFPNRSVTQLRARYRNTLQNRHKHTAWSLEDDGKLMEFVKVNGTSSWLLCSETALDNKHSRTSCRTRFLTIMRFFKKNPNALLADLPRKKVYSIDSGITTENWIEKVSELCKNSQLSHRPLLQASKTAESGRSCRKSLTKSPPSPPRQIGAKLNIKATEKRCRRKVIYVERLRPFELELYNFLKYAYNFHLGTDQHIEAPHDANTVCQLSHALAFKLPPKGIYEHGNILPYAVRTSCKVVLQLAAGKNSLPAGQHLPPSYPSLMSFRALCVHTAQINATATTSAATAIATENEAILLFRTRLRSLLFETCLLSRLQPNTIRALPARQQALLVPLQNQQQQQPVLNESVTVESPEENKKGCGKRRRKAQTNARVGSKRKCAELSKRKAAGKAEIEI